MNKDKPTVLVVDDVADNVQVLLSALKNDFSVLAATNGKDAIELSLSDHQPDIILLDVLMPEMDGYEVCRRLKAEERTEDIPVIFITILDENESELKGLELGAVDYITKPIIPELVRARIFNHIELKRHRDNLKEMLKEKEELMIAQSRQAAMGEMISMIAHQWRQPITALSMVGNNLKLDIELDKEIKTEELEKMVNIIGEQTQHLSQTIDDFRNFLKPKQEKQVTTMGTALGNTMKIIGRSLKNKNITVEIEDLSDTELLTYSNQLLQVLLNIFNNAKDVLIDKSIVDAKVTVNIYETKDSVVTTICDNGGGIPEEVIKHLGEPYFTTKGKTGTGLGLHMSKTIMIKHLNGSLTWENRGNSACFIVTLPKE